MTKKDEVIPDILPEVIDVPDKFYKMISFPDGFMI